MYHGLDAQLLPSAPLAFPMVMYNGTFETNETPGLQDYLKAIQARKLLVLCFLLAGVALAYLFTSGRTAEYEAGARVLVAPSPVRSSNSANLPKPNLETEREILASEAVAQVVSSAVVGADQPREILRDLDVEFRTGSEVLSLSYQSPDPRVSAQVVNGFANTYVQQRVTETNAFYEAESSALRVGVDSVNEQIVAIDSDLSRIEREIANVDPTDDASTSQLDTLRAERTVQAGQRSQLTAERIRIQNSLRDLQQQQQGRSVAAAVLELADPPTSPVGLGERLLWIVGGLLGLIAGIIAAFVADRLDTTAREESDVELAVGQSVVGSIPPFSFGTVRGAASLVMLSSNTSTRVQRAQESFRRLRTSIQYISTSDSIHSFLVTSSQPAEGKSTISANLAVALAQAGNTVVLVSADMRRPTIETLFGIRNNSGLSTYLGDQEATFPPVISIGIDNLALIPSGPSPSNPGELLGSTAFRELIIQLEATYDIVIVDSPPVLSAADAPAAAPSLGGVLLVVDSKRTDTETLLKVRSDLERAGARIVGSLLNKDGSRSTKFWSRRDRYAYERASAQLSR